MILQNRIAEELKKMLFPFVFQPNAQLLMEIVRFDIVNHVIILDIIIFVVLIISTILNFHKLMKWILLCELI